jgi:hypothetical protein
VDNGALICGEIGHKILWRICGRPQNLWPIFCGHRNNSSHKIWPQNFVASHKKSPKFHKKSKVVDVASLRRYFHLSVSSVTLERRWGVLKLQVCKPTPTLAYIGCKPTPVGFRLALGAV